jgi:hypothetical protein
LAQAEQRLRLAQEESRKQRQTIRTLNNELGILTVDDPSQVHVIARDAFGIAPFPRRFEVPWRSSFAWHAHLPDSSYWRICWADGEIALDGTLPVMSGYHIIRPAADSDGTTTFAVVHLGPWESGVVLVVGSARDVRPVIFHFATGTEFLAEDEICMETAGSARQGLPGTETFPPTRPIVLLRQWRMRTGEHASTRPGIVVWLEPVAKMPGVPQSSASPGMAGE